LTECTIEILIDYGNKSHQKIWDSPYSLAEIPSIDNEILNLIISINNLPYQGRYQFITFNDTRMTSGGLIRNYLESSYCVEGDQLVIFAQLLQYFEYNTVFLRELATSETLLASSFAKDKCSHGTNSSINFFIEGVYQIGTRYPENVISAFGKIGGLLAFFRIAVFFSYLHRRMYEKEIVQKLKKTQA
jgi:hypothetical protein